MQRKTDRPLTFDKNLMSPNAQCEETILDGNATIIADQFDFEKSPICDANLTMTNVNTQIENDYEVLDCANFYNDNLDGLPFAINIDGNVFDDLSVSSRNDELNDNSDVITNNDDNHSYDNQAIERFNEEGPIDYSINFMESDESDLDEELNNLSFDEDDLVDFSFNFMESDLDEEQINMIDNDINDEEPDNQSSFYQNDEKIHPSLDCTKFEVLLMILTMYIRHNWTWTALEDVLTFVNFLFGRKTLPESKYLFKKIFSKQILPVYHFYCESCKVYIEDTSIQICSNCQNCINYNTTKKIIFL